MGRSILTHDQGQRTDEGWLTRSTLCPPFNNVTARGCAVTFLAYPPRREVASTLPPGGNPFQYKAFALAADRKRDTQKRKFLL